MPKPDFDPDDKLKTLMMEAMAESTVAKRRVEAAREEVARLERDLSAATSRLNIEQAEYDMAGKMMWEMFDYFKTEVKRRWKTEPPSDAMGRCPSNFTDREDEHKLHECQLGMGHEGSHESFSGATWTDALTAGVSAKGEDA